MALKLGKCRLCLKLGDFYSIFSVDSSTQLAEMAMACAQVKIYEGDGLPEKVCGECVEKLSSAYIFKQQCERSDQELRRNYVPPPGFSQTPPPNRQSSDSGFSNRTDASCPPKNTVISEEPQPTASSSGSTRKRKRISDETKNKNLLQESYSIQASPAASDYSRPKTPDKRPRYEQDSDYEYPAPDNYNSDDSNTVYRCSQCERTFDNKKSLALHKRVHTKEKSSSGMRTDAVVDIPVQEVPLTPKDGYVCNDCGKTFKLQIMLKRHAESCKNKNPEETQTCVKCNKQFKTVVDLVNHQQTCITEIPKTSQEKPSCKQSPVECIFCDTPFNDYYNYCAHFNTCPDQKTLECFECTLCPSRFNRKSNFFRHLKEKHFVMSRISVAAETKDTFECRICSKKLESQDLLVTHLAAHMSNIDDGSSGHTGGDESVEDGVSLNSDMETKGRKEQQCQYCEKKFTYIKSLTSHIAAKHSGAQPVTVKTEVEEPPPPRTPFASDGEDDDEDYFGEGETDNTCDICEKHFSYRKTLLQHKAKKHPVTSGQKLSKVKFNKCEVKCVHCNVTMLAKEIKPHNQVHINANIKPKNIYTCYECGGTFKGSQPLRIHIKYVHRLNQPEPAKVTRPPSQYQITDLANFCEVVVTKTEPMDALQGHNDYRSVPGQVVDGMKPVVDLSGFTCPLCNKKMGTLISLKRHINWHNNVGKNIENKHKCEICNLEFKFKSHYKLHMKEHYFDTNLDPKFLTCGICNRKSKHLRAATAHAQWHKQTRFNNKDYQCSICNRIFQFRKTYLHHMAVHYKKGDSIEKLNIDITSKPTTSSPDGDEHKCPHCQKVLESAMSLKCHMSWHTSKSALYGSRYECEICHTQFTNKRRHELHIRTHYEDEAGPYKCPICGKGYNHEEFFQRHVKGHNFDNQSLVKKRQKLREMRQKKVQCPICCRYYPDLLHLVRHIRRAHPQSKMVKTDPDAPPAKVFPCKLCAKVFLDEKRLQFHEEAHLRKPLHYICKFCGRKNISVKNHNVHVKSHLVKKYREQPLDCPNCDEKFTLGYALHHHLRDVHGINETWAAEREAERPTGPLEKFQCSLCFKVLKTLLYYERHIDYHNTLRCNYCFEYFSGKVFLDGHLAFSCEKRRLIGETEVHVRRTKCSVCFKAFHLQVKLDCHMWSQHGVRDFERRVSSKLEIVCDFCFRVFDNEETLTGHKLYHRSIGYYGCLYCNRKFNSVTNYNKHKNHHLSQMCIDDPVKCEHCDEKFDWFRDMIYHMRDVHGDDKEWITMPKESIEEECNICHKRFYNLQRHLRYHEENRCRKCREYFYSRADFDAHLCDVVSDDEETIELDGTVVVYPECEFCFKQTSRTVSKQRHDLLHKTAGAISCRLCPSKFKTMDSYNIHSFSHRSRKYKKNPLVCPVCREKFVQYGPFVRHIRGLHKMKKQMHYRATILAEPCVVCHRSLPNLHNHYRAHLQNRCISCLKYFTSTKLFQNHSCDKEDSDPSKVFMCEENLLELITVYVPKEENEEMKYYGLTDSEQEMEPVKEEENVEQKHDSIFAEVTPVISEITSLKPAGAVAQNGRADSDDDCVVVIVGDSETADTDTICIDD